MPAEVGEAVSLLAEEPDRLIVAGGTDVVPSLTARALAPRRVLSLARLSKLDGVGPDGSGALRIGARLTAAGAPAVAALLPAFAHAAAFGPPGVRGVATVGGNVVSAAGGDLLPLLVATRARVVLESTQGTRRVPVAGFLERRARRCEPGWVLDLDDPEHCQLRSGELVVGICIAALPADAAVARLVLPGCGGRAALAMAVARDAQEPRIRVAVQQGAGIPVRARDAEAGISAELARVGRAVSPAAAADFARGVGALGGDPYLRKAGTVLARRLLTRILAAP